MGNSSSKDSNSSSSRRKSGSSSRFSDNDDSSMYGLSGTGSSSSSNDPGYYGLSDDSSDPGYYGSKNSSSGLGSDDSSMMSSLGLSGKSSRSSGSSGKSKGFFGSLGSSIGSIFSGSSGSSGSSSSGSSGSSSSSGSSGSSGSDDSFTSKISDSLGLSSSKRSKDKGWYEKVFGVGSSSSSGSSESDSSSKSSSDSFMSSVVGVLNGNTILERFIFVILVVICFVVLLSVGSNILSAILEPSNPYIVDGLYTASNGKVIPQDPKKSGSVSITRSDNETNGIEFSWSIWLNVTSLDDSPGNAGQYKHIFSKGDNDNVPIDSRGLNSPNNSPGLYIDKNTNSIIVIMNTFEQIEEMITVTDVPLNKWVHVLIRVEGAYFDVYINGTLAKRKVLGSVPKQNNGNVYLCQNGGFSGFISNLRYYKSALEPGDILRIVNKGPSLKLSKLEKKDLKNGNLNYLAMDWYFQNASS